MLASYRDAQLKDCDACGRRIDYHGQFAVARERRPPPSPAPKTPPPTAAYAPLHLDCLATPTTITS